MEKEENQLFDPSVFGERYPTIPDDAELPEQVKLNYQQGGGKKEWITSMCERVRSNVSIEQVERFLSTSIDHSSEERIEIANFPLDNTNGFVCHILKGSNGPNRKCEELIFQIKSNDGAFISDMSVLVNRNTDEQPTDKTWCYNHRFVVPEHRGNGLFPVITAGIHHFLDIYASTKGPQKIVSRLRSPDVMNAYIKQGYRPDDSTQNERFDKICDGDPSLHIEYLLRRPGGEIDYSGSPLCVDTESGEEFPVDFSYTIVSAQNERRVLDDVSNIRAQFRL
jgi:hypothetical protein